jgi:pyridoxine 4-dehydrogenase
MADGVPGGSLKLADDLVISRMGFGAMQLAGPGVFGPPGDRDQALAVLREAVDMGITHIDTSDFYGPFVVNELIREALHPYPADLRIVTKVGARRGEDASWRPSQDPADLRAQVRENLEHLGVDVLDAVNLRVPAESTGEDSTVQNLYNLVSRADDALVDRCAAENIAYAAFFPLGGFTPLQSATLNTVAEGLGATPHQVALAWLLQRSATMVLIPGTSSVAHLRENVAAANLVLPPDAIAELDTIGR